jgi:hypothetical protein
MRFERAFRSYSRVHLGTALNIIHLASYCITALVYSLLSYPKKERNPRVRGSSAEAALVIKS